MKYTSILIAATSATAISNRAGFTYDTDGSTLTENLAADMMHLAEVFGYSDTAVYWTDLADTTNDKATVWTFLGTLMTGLGNISEQVGVAHDAINGMID